MLKVRLRPWYTWKKFMIVDRVHGWNRKVKDARYKTNAYWDMKEKELKGYVQLQMDI